MTFWTIYIIGILETRKYAKETVVTHNALIPVDILRVITQEFTTASITFDRLISVFQYFHVNLFKFNRKNDQGQNRTTNQKNKDDSHCTANG